MTPQESDLIQLIAREVIALLKQRQSQSGVTASVAAAPERADASISPPLGTCTGDYSKYPNLTQRLNPPKHVAAPAASAAASIVSAEQDTSAPVAPAQALLTGFVTENQLREAIKHSPAGVAYLAADARLTPLGNDFARQFPEKVRRADQGQKSIKHASSTAAYGPRDTKLPWLWWIQGNCPVVTKLTSERAASLRTVTAGHREENLISVVRELANAVKSGNAAGGLLFVPSAARAVCLANRCQSLRAVVATCGQAVEEGVRELGANVLVVEYLHHGPRSIAGMIDRILQSPPAAPASVQRDLADLHRCG